MLPHARTDTARKAVRIRPGGTLLSRECTQKRNLVAQLLGKRKAEDPEDKEEYLVDCLGYEKDCSWEPTWMLLKDVPEIVKMFEASHKERETQKLGNVIFLDNFSYT